MILTIKQAIEQGYERCGYEGRDYQSLIKIEGLNKADFEQGKIVLAEIESYYTPAIDPDTIAEIMADTIFSDLNDNTSDDTDDIYDKVKGLDYSSVADMINEALKNNHYYRLTEIELINNELSFSE